MEVKYYNLEGGSCLGCDKTKGAVEVHIQGLLMWAIHDLLAYGLFSNQVTHGYKGCPMCGPNKISQDSKRLGKTTYVHHHRWLQRNHPYQTNVCDFNGKFGRSLPQPIMLGFDVLLQANLFETWKLKGGKEEGNPSQQNGVRKLST